MAHVYRRAVSPVLATYFGLCRLAQIAQKPNVTEQSHTMAQAPARARRKIAPAIRVVQETSSGLLLAG